jgi:hypothetical protein
MEGNSKLACELFNIAHERFRKFSYKRRSRMAVKALEQESTLNLRLFTVMSVPVLR